MTGIKRDSGRRAAAGTIGANLDTLALAAGLCRCDGLEAKVFGTFAGFTPFRRVAELFGPEKCLLARGPDESL